MNFSPQQVHFSDRIPSRLTPKEEQEICGSFPCIFADRINKIQADLNIQESLSFTFEPYSVFPFMTELTNHLPVAISSNQRLKTGF